MANRAESSVFDRGRETVEAHAGSVLSALCVVSPVVRQRFVGPENEGRHLPGYPLTPLLWRVAHTLRREQRAIGFEALAEFRGDTPGPDDVPPYRPLDYPHAGITSVRAAALRPAYGDPGIPIVYWPYGDRLMAARIPDRHLDAVGRYDDFRWAMRFAERGQFGAGRLLMGRVVAAAEVEPFDVVPVDQVPAGIPAY